MHATHTQHNTEISAPVLMAIMQLYAIWIQMIGFVRKSDTRYALAAFGGNTASSCCPKKIYWVG